MRKNYQRKERKSNHKFEVIGGQELLVQVPLPCDAEIIQMPVGNSGRYASPIPLAKV